MSEKIINIKRFFEKEILFMAVSILFFLCSIDSVYAAKYTLCTGKEFNIRIKASINSSYTSATKEENIVAFKRSDMIPDGAKLIDISEDGDKTIVAYVDKNIIYYVSDDDVFFNQDMSYMFDKFTAIKRIDLEEFDFSKCRKMNFMFSNCHNLTDLNMDNDTEIKPNEIVGMFNNCLNINDIDLFMLNTKSVTSFKDLFRDCINVKNIQIDTNIFTTSKVKDFSGMFKNCYLLKTNFGKKAIDIDESLYKTYAKAGDDDIEGLLKDFDYEYDDYGANVKNIDVKSLSNIITDSNENENVSNMISDDEINSAKSFLDAKLPEDSSLTNQTVGDSYMLTDDDILNQLLLETTIVPDFEEKVKARRERENKALDYGIEEEEMSSPSFVPGRVNRPTLDDYKKINEENNIVPDDEEPYEIKKYTTINKSILIVIIAIPLIIICGILLFKNRNKKDDEELDKFDET